MEATGRELVVFGLFHYLVLFDVVNNLLAGPNRVLVGVEVKAAEKLALVLLWRPPRVGSLLQLIFYSKNDFLWDLEDVLLATQLERYVQILGISNHKLIAGFRRLLQLLWKGIHVLAESDYVEQVDSADEASGQVPFGEWWQVLAQRPIELPVLLLHGVNFLLSRFLLAGLNVERTSVLVGPLSPLESFESIDQQGSPGLVHRQAHTLVVLLAVERLVRSVGLFGLLGLLNDSSFHCLAELFEGVL